MVVFQPLPKRLQLGLLTLNFLNSQGFYPCMGAPTSQHYPMLLQPSYCGMESKTKMSQYLSVPILYTMNVITHSALDTLQVPSQSTPVLTASKRYHEQSYQEPLNLPTIPSGSYSPCLSLQSLTASC